MEDVSAAADFPRVNGRARSAVILARGAGTRMRAADDSAGLTAEQAAAAAGGEKAFMPVAGRAFLDYLLDAIRAAGIERVGVVVAPGRALDSGLAAIVQAEARGTANAVLAAREWAGDRPFLVMNGDNLYPVPAIAAVAALDGPGLAGFDRDDLVADGNIPPERVAAFAVIERDASGHLQRIVEKPTQEALAACPRPVLVSMNLWRFDARIFDACRDVDASPRGEFELPAAVMLAQSRGVRFAVVPAAGPVLDLSQRGDVTAVARRLSPAAPSGGDVR